MEGRSGLLPSFVFLPSVVEKEGPDWLLSRHSQDVLFMNTDWDLFSGVGCFPGLRHLVFLLVPFCFHSSFSIT